MSCTLCPTDSPDVCVTVPVPRKDNVILPVQPVSTTISTTRYLLLLSYLCVPLHLCVPLYLNVSLLTVSPVLNSMSDKVCVSQFPCLYLQISLSPVYVPVSVSLLCIYVSLLCICIWHLCGWIPCITTTTQLSHSNVSLVRM